MQQESLTQRLQNIRKRCMAVSGGINAVANEMNRSKTTLHNWFKGVTVPSVDDVEFLVNRLTLMEAKDEQKKRDDEQRLNAVLGNQTEQLTNALAA